MGYYEISLLTLVLLVGDIQAGCPAGSFLRGETCLVCSAGYYESGGACEACPRDQYNDAEQATECKACPDGKETLEEGSDAENKCIDLCEIPATYNAGYRVSTDQGLYSVSSQDRVPYDTRLVFVCAPGYQYDNTNTNKLEKTCSADVGDLPKFCIRLEASQEGETYLVSTEEKSVTVSCQVFPLQQDTYASVHFFKDDVKMTQDPVVLVASGDTHKSATYTVQEEGTWRCGLADDITGDINKPVSDAVISKLTLTMEKPDELAVSTAEYTISCAASYLDTMALPELTLTLNGNAVPGTTSNIDGSTYRISKLFTTPSSEIAGQYTCDSKWKITDGVYISESRLRQTVDFLGFKTEYPGREDGTSAEKTIASKDKDFTLLCETFPVSGTQPTVKFFLDGSETASAGSSLAVTPTAEKTVYCTATVGSQTVTSKTMTLVPTELTVELTPALVYGAVGDTLTLTCSMTGENADLFIQQFSTAVLNTYVDGSSTFTKDSADKDDTGAFKFDITISKTNTWARCGIYILSEGVNFYSSPIRIYYRESTVFPDYLVLLAGESSSFTLQVYGDPSQVTVSSLEIQANEITDKSSDWMTYYEVPVTSAKTKWYGPLDFTITYDSDKDTDVKETKLYVTDVSVSAYSENIAAAQDIVLICSHVNPPVYNLPSVTWTKGEVVIEDSARVEITNGKDETTLKIKSVDESDTGLYKCAVDFKNKTDVVMFQKTSDPGVQQNVVGEAYFSDSKDWMGQQVNEVFQISCNVHYSRPSNSDGPNIGVQCQDSGVEGWVNKKEKTTSKTATKFTESFDVTMVETMNNKDCRCFGEFFDADLKSYEISSPLTRVFAYAVKRLPGSDEKHFSMISHSVTMKCSANGNGTLPIQWKKGDTKLSGSKYTVTGEEPIDGVYTSTLVITQITAEMDGGYACYVAYQVNTQLQADFTLHVLHIEEFSTSIRYENEGSSVSLTCKVSQIGDKVPTVTWDQDGTTKEGCDTSIVRGDTLDCVHVLTITAQLERSVSCSAEYRAQPSLKGQSQKSGAVTIISQRVWSDQSKVTVVDGETARYVCYGSGNQNAMRATLNYPGNPTAVKENIGTYEAKFSFVMAEITSDKEAEYQCELNFATPVQLAVTVEIMRLTKGFPLETTFQTVNQVQNFTCATELLGDNTNAKIRFDGGPSADPNLFKYFDTEGEASSTLILKPITETMNMKEYKCSVEIKGSDADGDLTSEGLFVVQFVKLEKKSYFGVDKQPLSIPCVASGRKEHVEQISWTSPDGSKNSGDKQAYMTQSFSLKSVLTQDLSPEKDGDYTCSVPYDTYPHQDVLNLKVLKIEENPTSQSYLQVGDVATISCTGSAHGHTVVPIFLWNYVSDINTDKQETCNTQYNPNTAGKLPTPTNTMGVSTIQHSIVKSDHLRSVDCTMSWSGTDADGSLTTTPALIVVTYIDAQDEVFVIEGQDGKITCMAYGPDSVDFTWWYKENEDSSAFIELTQGGDYDITKTNWDSTCHKRSSTLTVKSSAASHEGKYKCKTSDNEVTTPDLEEEILLKVYRVVEFRTDKEGAITQFDSASLACIASYPGGKFNFIKKVDGKEPEVQYSDYEVETDVSEDYEAKSFLTDKWVAAGWNIQKFDVDDVGEYECMVEWDGEAAPVKELDLEISLVCQRPDITNGKLLTADPDTVWVKKGESGTVTCEPGYTLSGESSVKCDDGQLKTPTGGALTAQCLAVPEKRCVVLPAPTNGRLNCVMSSGNLVCSVDCNSGFLISDATDNEYTCTANSGENWDHVDATNPLGKTATCDKLTARIYTYRMDDQGCSAINSAYGSRCDVNCKEVLKELNCDDSAGTTITIKSLKSSTEVLQALEDLTASQTDNGRKRREAGSSRFTFVSDQSSCGTGSALNGEYCVECSAGYYASDNTCKRCAVGTYSDSSGSTECTECTGELSTLGEAVSHSSECIEVCRIPALNKGSSYPPEDYTVPAGTTLTLTCNTGYDLEYNQADEIECADVLPKCYERCPVQIPQYDNLGLKKVEIGSSFIDKIQQPSALCGGKDVKCTGANNPSIVHGFPIKAVCVDVKAMENGKTEQILYCQEKVLFSFPDCSECKTGCSESEWQCNSDCSCIDNSQRCDGEENCKLNSNKPWISDEYDCPVDITDPQGIQFDHWQQEESSIEPVIFNYNQDKDWKQFATCLWLQTSYKGPQTVFSYGGKISVSVHDQLLAVHFNFDSTTSGSTFSNTAAGISDGTYRRVCLSWNSLGGVVDLYYEDRDIINDEDFKTWSVSGKVLPAGDVVNLAVGGTEADKSNSFHGFIKDMVVMQKLLIKEDIDNFRYCKFPAEDSTRIEWSKILTQAKSKATKYYIMEYSYRGCSAPTCETSCPVNMFMCGSCDCVSPWQRCDLFTQHCIDSSDENDCKKTNGVFKPYNNQQDYENSGRKCVTEGGYLASIDSEFENELSANSLEIDDIRTAWIGTRVVKGKALSTWVSGAPKSQWAVSYYTDTTKVDKFVGLKNDKNWLPIYGLFSDNLPYLCRTQGYLIAKLDESPLSVEDWRAKCTATNDLTHFTLADAHYSDRAESVLQSRALHKSDGWEGVAWAKSRLTCDYMRSNGSNPIECATYWNIPSFCGVQVELEQVTQAVLSGEQDSYFLWNNPWNDKLSSDGTSELSLCFNVKSADELGTVLRYSAGSYQNEILVLLSSKSKHAPLDILEFTVHNRVNFFGVQLLDGVWHSVCLAWQTATGPSNNQGTVKLVVDGAAITRDKTLAVWPKNLYNAKLNNTGVLYVGRQGDASYSESISFKGSIMNLNVWKKLLSADEMKQMTKKTSDSFKCGPIVVQEPNLILRWRDLLHYSSSGVKISTTPDHQHCGVLRYGAPFRAGHVIEEGTVGEELIKLKSAEGKEGGKQAVRFGDTVRILKDDNDWMVKCEKSQCSFIQCSADDPCGTTFVVSSDKWEIGRAVAIADDAFLKNVDEKTIKGLTGTGGDLTLEDQTNTFNVAVDKQGWTTSETGDCGEDCQKSITRECVGGTAGDTVCPGDVSGIIKQYCQCPAQSGCTAPEAASIFSGIYTWRNYQEGYFALCPYGSFKDRFLPLTVIASCDATYVNTTCSFQSEAAQELYKILYSQTIISDENVEDIASQTSAAISKADDLGTVHLNLAADISTNITTVANITEGVVNSVLDVFDTLTITVSDEDIASSKKESGAPKKLVDSIETAAKKMRPEAGKEITLQKKSVGIKVMDIPDTQVGSVSFSLTKKASTPIDEVDFSTDNRDTDGNKKRTGVMTRQGGNGSTLNDTPAETTDLAEETPMTVSIEIAEDVARKTKQLSFMVYNNSKMFIASREHVVVADSAIGNPFETGTLSIMSSVLGGSVDAETAAETTDIDSKTKRSTPVATLTMSAQGGVDKDRTPYCVYWDDAAQMWSQTGLQITSCNPTGVSCSSDHLTNFAVLMNVGNNSFSPAHQTAMTVLTITGSSLSILCLTLTVVGLAIGKMRRNPTYHIHLCLALTLGLAMLVFLVGLDRRENFVVCKVFAVLIHYMFLSSICWMLVEGVNLYIALIIVFGVNHKKLKIAAHCFSWGFPALICLITVLTDAFVAGFELYEVCMTAKYCFLNHRGRMYFFVAPIMLMMAVNIFIFVRVIIVLAKATKNRDGWTDLRQVTVIASITGISWVFGAMTVGGSVGTLVFNYLYIILNSFQGIVIFYFHCFGKPDVRNAWTEKLSTGTSRFMTSSNNSAGAPASYGTTGRKISTATGVSGDARYSTATNPRFSTATLPGQPGKRISAIVPPGPRVGTNGRPKRISAAPLSPMPFQAQPNPRLMGGKLDEKDIELQSVRVNDEEAAYDTIEIHKEPDQTGTGRRRRKKQTNETNTDSCLVAENQYATLDEAEEPQKKEEEEKEVKILNTDQQEAVPEEIDPDIEADLAIEDLAIENLAIEDLSIEDLAIEDVELAPTEAQPALSRNTLQMSVAGEEAGDAGTDMVYLPDMGSERI